jgi:hypothetical protein
VGRYSSHKREPDEGRYEYVERRAKFERCGQSGGEHGAGKLDSGAKHEQSDYVRKQVAVHHQHADTAQHREHRSAKHRKAIKMTNISRAGAGIDGFRLSAVGFARKNHRSPTGARPTLSITESENRTTAVDEAKDEGNRIALAVAASTM